MDIKFVMVTTGEGEYIEAPSIKYTMIPSLDFEEVKSQYSQQLREDLIDKKTYSFIKALEKNEDFEKTVKSFRRECEIPVNGYEYKEWIKFNEHSLEHSLGLERSRYDEHYRKIILSGVFEKITRKFSIPSILHASIPHVVTANMIFLPIHRIELELDGHPKSLYRGPVMNISIRDNISRNELKNFIDSKWDLMQENFDAFTDFKNTYISKRDYEIIELRDNKGMGFEDIAKYIEHKYGTFGFSYSAAKTAYHSAKEKITQLSKPTKSPSAC